MDAEFSTNRVISGNGLQESERVNQTRGSLIVAHLSCTQTHSQITYRNEDIPLSGHSNRPPAVGGTSTADFLMFGAGPTWHR